MTTHTPEFGYDWISLYHPTWKQHLPPTTSSILEIGCFEGRSTCWFLENYPAVHITCIDTFEGGLDHQQLGLDFTDTERRFRHNTTPWRHRIHLYKSTSAAWLRSVSLYPHFDTILIDGSHLACDVFTDLALSWPLLQPNGILILDDYGWGLDRPPHERPAPAIDAFLACFTNQYTILENGYQLLLRKL